MASNSAVYSNIRSFNDRHDHRGDLQAWGLRLYAVRHHGHGGGSWHSLLPRPLSEEALNNLGDGSCLLAAFAFWGIMLTSGWFVGESILAENVDGIMSFGLTSGFSWLGFTESWTRFFDGEDGL